MLNNPFYCKIICYFGHLLGVLVLFPQKLSVPFPHTTPSLPDGSSPVRPSRDHQPLDRVLQDLSTVFGSPPSRTSGRARVGLARVPGASAAPAPRNRGCKRDGGEGWGSRQSRDWGLLNNQRGARNKGPPVAEPLRPVGGAGSTQDVDCGGGRGRGMGEPLSPVSVGRSAPAARRGLAGPPGSLLGPPSAL